MILGDFIFKDKKNRLYFWLAIGLSVANLLFFKCKLYLPANFGYATKGLIEEATTNASVGLWPIGYARVLSFFHLFTHSDTVLIAFQYFFLTGILLYFFFTFHYFYGLAKNSFLLLFVFLFFDPLFLYLANCITADALFTGVSIWWITQLFWIIHRPRPYQVFLQAGLICIAFALNYQAAWYPLIALVALLLSRQTLVLKITGAILPLIFIGLFFIHTRDANYKEVGLRRFSVFSGWREANNALFFYPHIDIDHSQMPTELAALDDTIQVVFERDFKHLKDVTPIHGLFFLETPNTPLQHFLYPVKQIRLPGIDYKQWATVSPLYEKYAHFLRKHYPWAYGRYYVLANVGRYFWPRVDKLATFNTGQDTVDATTRTWFRYSQPAFINPDGRFGEVAIGGFSALFPVVNLAIVVGLIWLIVVGEKKNYPILFLGLTFTLAFLVINAIANIWFAPVMLEAVITPLITAFSYLLLLYDCIEKKYKATLSSNISPKM